MTLTLIPLGFILRKEIIEIIEIREKLKEREPLMETQEDMLMKEVKHSASMLKSDLDDTSELDEED